MSKLKQLHERFLPSGDRDQFGYLHWRLWAPFYASGNLTGRLWEHLSNQGAWALFLAIPIAVGLPWFLALHLTRRSAAKVTA